MSANANYFTNQHGQLYMMPTYLIRPPFHMEPRVIQHPQLQFQPQPLPIQPPPQPIQPPPREGVQIELPPQPQTKEQTNVKIRSIKEKCITHYVDGQLIIETTKPLSEKKLKSSKKKRQLVPHQIVSQQITPQQIAPQQIVPQQQEQPKREVQIEDVKQVQIDDVQQVRANMPKWSVSEVVDFIERHEDIKQYSSKFAEDEVDGKALMLMIDRNLNFQILTSMFKHGPAMKIEATLSKYKINDGQ